MDESTAHVINYILFYPYCINEQYFMLAVNILGCLHVREDHTTLKQQRANLFSDDQYLYWEEIRGQQRFTSRVWEKDLEQGRRGWSPLIRTKLVARLIRA